MILDGVTVDGAVFGFGFFGGMAAGVVEVEGDGEVADAGDSVVGLIAVGFGVAANCASDFLSWQSAVYGELAAGGSFSFTRSPPARVLPPMVTM